MKPTKAFFENAKAYKDGFRVIVNKGSARSSKTVSLIQLMDLIAMKSAKHRKISIVSHSFPHLNDGAIYEYEKYMMRENIVRNHNKGKHFFEINKSLINYFSLDVGGNKAIGPGRDILYLNEPNRGISFSSYNDLKSRTTECIFMDYNPSGMFWLQKEGIIDDDRTIVIKSTWLDNIDNLTPAQIEDFIDAKRKSKYSDYWNYWWKVYGLGEDAVLLNERIMPFVKRISKVPDDATEIPSALDFGFFPDPTSFNRLFIRKNPNSDGKRKMKEDLFIMPIVYEQKLSINTASPNAKNLVDELCRKGIKPGHRVIAECADPGAINEMRLAKWSVEAVRKTSIETSIRLFHDYNIYIVDGPDKDVTEAVYQEFESYRYKKDKMDNILAIPEKGQADHAIDGTRYVLLSRDSRWSFK